MPAGRDDFVAPTLRKSRWRGLLSNVCAFWKVYEQEAGFWKAQFEKIAYNMYFEFVRSQDARQLGSSMCVYLGVRLVNSLETAVEGLIA
jgi:hypothetical protein